MNPKCLKLSALVLLLLFLGAGCEKDETIPNPKVECSFFLLNQTGSPDTIFAEGENFTFYFEINTDDPEWRFNGFQLNDSNFN
jgi:hypothetical protein